jgi:hypothetical protein
MTEIAEPTLIDVKQAVQAAFAYVSELFPKDQVKDLRLEEVELTDDGKYWLVTVGMSSPILEYVEYPIALRSPLQERKLRREYKQLKIDARTGKVLSMKIRVP